MKKPEGMSEKNYYHLINAKQRFLEEKAAEVGLTRDEQIEYMECQIIIAAIEQLINEAVERHD